MRVWLASEGDLGDAARLIAEFRSHYGRETPTDEEMRESVERIAATDGEFLLASADDGEAEGVCQLRYRWSVWTSAEDCWVEDVFVSEAARGSGLGRALMEAALERAWKRGCRRIELDVDEANTAALALYESLGFSGEFKAEKRSLLLGRRLE